MNRRKWCAVGVAAVLTHWFASPADARIDPAKCRAPIVASDERIAACTAVIETVAGPKIGLAWAFRMRAAEYLKARDFDRAIADYSEVLQLYPQDRYALICRGNANRQRRNLDQAIADYDQAIGLDPNDGQAYTIRAEAYALKDDFDRAFADYARALELNRSDARAYLSRGRAYRNKNDVDHAIVDYDQAIRIVPTFQYAYLARGAAYAAKGNFDRALADYDEGIRLDPKSASAYRGRAIVHLRAGSLVKSLADLDRSRELDPKDSYTGLWREIVARRSDQPSRLADATAQLDMTKWPAPVVRLFLGETTPEAVLAAAESSNPELQRGQVCEGNFYAGELALQRGSKEDAARLFALSVSDCPKGFVERSAAGAELKALGVDH